MVTGFRYWGEISFACVHSMGDRFSVKNELVLERVVSPIFSENCYIVARVGRTECLVFDPGSDFDSIIALVERNGWTPAAILNTHGHADHIAGNEALKKRWPEAPLIIGEKEVDKLSDPDQNLSSMYGMGFTSPPADRLVKHGEVLDLAGFELQVRDTPGHSSGHVVFVWKGEARSIVFGGDVLFEGSIGRTDFPDGDFEQLAQSIREQLYTLPADTIVLPGHGPPTTVGAEIETNPFVAGKAG